MSAFVIEDSSHRPLTERSRLLPSDPPSLTSHSGSSRPAQTSQSSHFNKILDRSAPLRDSISSTRFVIICAGIWSANFVFAFQASAIPTLAPSISSGFNHAELGSYLGGVFTLTSAAGSSDAFGMEREYCRSDDCLGRKFAMDTACFFFGIGTICCALSESIYGLIAARGLAGLGGGGLLTVSSVIVTDLVSLRDRGFYQGIMMTIFGGGGMLGGPLAGWLTDRYGWPLSFWLQLPIISFCAIIVTIFLPQSIIPPTHLSLRSGLASLDWLGSILLLGSVTTLILGFSFHTSYLEPWSAPIVWGLLLAAALSMMAFVFVEIKFAAHPIVPMGILKSRHRSAVLASGFFLSVGTTAFTYQMPAYFSIVVNTSTAQSGVIPSVCGGLGLAMGSMLAGQYIRKGGAYRLLGILSLVPSVIAPLVASAWRPNWPWWAYYVTYFPCSLGYSVFLCFAMISSVDSKSMPKATALLYTVRTLGGTIGVSVGGSIQLGALNSSLKSSFADINNRQDIITAILHSKSAIRMLPGNLQIRALDGYASSLATVWVVCGVIAMFALVSSCFIKEKELPGKITSTSPVKFTEDAEVVGTFPPDGEVNI
ncbi:MAG: hypothetical protein TREMPRED_001269 [Tremellales sp. Tagirdzhanova-0007]|nr:MAG: hypothetical protein TREMPRED_001269 [Tremellales sp. Tagirdzhanova-0007]